MKYLHMAALIFLLSACQSRTDLGPCVGVNDKQDPALAYHVSTRNVVVGVIFFEMVAPPIIVAFDELYCPISRRGNTP
jgi:hypothetical protein